MPGCNQATGCLPTIPQCESFLGLGKGAALPGGLPKVCCSKKLAGNRFASVSLLNAASSVKRPAKADREQYSSGAVCDLKAPVRPVRHFLLIFAKLFDRPHGLSPGLIEVSDLDSFLISYSFAAAYEIEIAFHNSRGGRCRIYDKVSASLRIEAL